MTRWLWLALFLLCGPIRAEDLPAYFSVTGVSPDDVLNLRESPDPTAPIIGGLAPDASGIEVVAFVDEWAVVNSDGVAAYAARRFLMREDGEAWSSLTSPVICSGTEPFWSLALDPSGGSAGFSTPERPDPMALAILELWPAEPWSSSAAVSLPVGMAVLRGTECSDGMSDQKFGIAIDLFLHESDGLRLVGCCSLSSG